MSDAVSDPTSSSATAPGGPAPEPLRLAKRHDRVVRAVTHGPPVITTKHLDVWFGARQVLAEIDMVFPERSVTALIGPSGCGKSTFLRCLNRMHELVPGARVRGSVRLRDRELYSTDANPIAIRRAIGMVFQRPNPFPTKSIAENILSGPKFNRVKMSRGERAELVEKALANAGLWNEVKDRLDAPAGGLSGGQQQRLCIARAVCRARRAVDGRTVLGARSPVDLPHRGPDRPAQARAHHHHRHPPHAAGRADQRLHRVHHDRERW